MFYFWSLVVDVGYASPRFVSFRFSTVSFVTVALQWLASWSRYVWFLFDGGMREEGREGGGTDGRMEGVVFF